MRVKGRDEKVDEVQGECKVRDELGARDEEEDEYDAADTQSTLASLYTLYTLKKKERKKEGKEVVPNRAINQPHEPQRPPDRRVAAQTLPAEDQIQRERGAGHQGREQDQHRRAGIVRSL